MNVEPHSDYAIEAAPSWDRPLVTVPVLSIIALVGGFFDSMTLAATVYVMLVGGTLMWLGLSAKAARRPALAGLGRAAQWWLVPAAMFVAVELINFALGSTYPHPTVSVLLDDPLTSYPIRAVGYYFWLQGFWGLIRR